MVYLKNGGKTMITEINEKKVISERDVDFEYDGRWVIFESKPYSTSGDLGCVVAYGDGTKEDRAALYELVHEKYNGQALLKFAYVPKEHVIYGMYDIGVADKK